MAMSVRVGGCRALSQVNLLVNLFKSYMLPLFFSGLLSYLVGMKRRTSGCFLCKRDNSHFLHYLKKKKKKKKKKKSIMPLGVFLVLI